MQCNLFLEKSLDKGGRRALGLLGSRLLTGTQNLSTLDGLGIGVETEHGTVVAQRVLLLLATAGALGTGGTGNGLDLVRVDETGDIGVGDDGSGKGVTRLLQRGGLEGTENGIQLFKGTLRPDDEATKMTTRGKLQKVQTLDASKLDTGNVAKGTANTIVLAVHDEGTTTLGVTAVPELTLTGTDGTASLYLFNVIIGTDGLHQLDGSLGLAQALDAIGNDKRHLGDLLDAVTTGHDKGRKGRGSDSRDGSIATLVDVDLSVPLAERLGRGKHATTTTHVTKGSLTGTVRTTTTDTGNTCNGTTRTPGLGRGLVTSLARDGVGLTVVLGNVAVNKVDDIRADGGLEDGRHLDSGDNRVTSFRVNTHGRTNGSHFLCT